jgi:hypothetical protein
MMAPVTSDEGWTISDCDALQVAGGITLFSPNPSSTFEPAAWRGAAERFFRLRWVLFGARPSPARPSTALELDVRRRDGVGGTVRLSTLPIERAPELMRAAEAAARAMGGAGFDVLLTRARRVWQISAADDAHPVAPLATAAVGAFVLLAPVLPPAGDVLFGVKGARERFEAMRS